MQDLLDHGESRKRQEEAEFARIDASAKEERDKQMGFRGKVCLPNVPKLRMQMTIVSCRSSMSWMDQTPDPPDRNQHLSTVSRTG